MIINAQQPLSVSQPPIRACRRPGRADAAVGFLLTLLAVGVGAALLLLLAASARGLM